MNGFSPLPRTFYHPTARIVARRLLGHFLVHRTPDGLCGGAIVETEAYLVGDPASHGLPGPTARNRVMFGAPGHAYVYLIYGFHFCFNAVCQPHNVAEAVLVRACEVNFGEILMRGRRSVKRVEQLTNGPGKLCRSLGITRALNGVDLCDSGSPLFIAENPERKRFLKDRGPQVTTTRIGLTKAAALPLRFYLDHSPFVSKRQGGSRRPRARSGRR